MVLRARPRDPDDHRQPARRAPDDPLRAKRRRQELAAAGRRRPSGRRARGAARRAGLRRLRAGRVRRLEGRPRRRPDRRDRERAVRPFCAGRTAPPLAAALGARSPRRHARRRELLADHPRPVRGVLPLPHAGSRARRLADELARCVNRPRAARELPDRDPRGRATRASATCSPGRSRTSTATTSQLETSIAMPPASDRGARSSTSTSSPARGAGSRSSRTRRGGARGVRTKAARTPNGDPGRGVQRRRDPGLHAARSRRPICSW